MQLLSLRFLKHMLINSTLRADIVELRPAMLVYRIARDRFAVAAHRFKNAWREYDQGDPDEEWGELYSGVPAPPWPTAGSLSYSIGLLQYDYEKIHAPYRGPSRVTGGESSYVKILDPLLDQEGCLELSHEIPRRC